MLGMERKRGETEREGKVESEKDGKKKWRRQGEEKKKMSEKVEMEKERGGRDRSEEGQ